MYSLIPASSSKYQDIPLETHRIGSWASLETDVVLSQRMQINFDEKIYTHISGYKNIIQREHKFPHCYIW